ncbi:MAG: hypothetical protein RIE32_13345 [Phycisphaerales bacterium]
MIEPARWMPKPNSLRASLRAPLVGALALLAVGAPALAQSTSQPASQPTNEPTSEPVRLFEAGGRAVLVHGVPGDGRIDFGGAPLAVEGQPVRRVVGAAAMGGHLLVAVRDGAVLVFELPGAFEAGEAGGAGETGETVGAAGAGGGDAGRTPRLVQVLDGLGRDLRAAGVDRERGRLLVLAGGTTEMFGVTLHEPSFWQEGDSTQRAYVDHARFLDMLREPAPTPDEPAGGQRGEDGRPVAAEPGASADPRTMAIGPRSLLLATDRGLLELLHPNRSYAVLARAPLPAGVARVESLAFAAGVGEGRWLLAGLNERAECVLLAAARPGGPWTDLGVATLDAALAGVGDDGEATPIAWLPGSFTVADDRVTLCIRGERGAAASWPAWRETLAADDLTIRWLDGEGDAGGDGGGGGAGGSGGDAPDAGR